MPGASVRSEDNGRARLLPPKTCTHLALPTTRWLEDLRAALPTGCPQACTWQGLLEPSVQLEGCRHDGHCSFLPLQAEPRGLGCPSGRFPSRAGNAVVTMEIQAPEGIGAAFLPVPSAHTWNWVSGTLLGAGAGVSCPLQATVPSAGKPVPEISHHPAAPPRL